MRTERELKKEKLGFLRAVVIDRKRDTHKLELIARSRAL